MMCSFLLGIAASVHISIEGDYNKIHPTARVECNRYITGIYYNSIEKASVYAGLKQHFTDDLYIEGGVVDGYQHDMEIVPFARLVYKNYFISPIYENNTDKTGIVAGVQFYLGD